MKATKDKEEQERDPKLDRIVLATSALQLAQSMGDPEKVDAAMRMLGDACDDFEKDYALRIQTVLASRAAAVEVVC
jgi:hypothetical protein